MSDANDAGARDVSNVQTDGHIAGNFNNDEKRTNTTKGKGPRRTSYMANNTNSVNFEGNTPRQ